MLQRPSVFIKCQDSALNIWVICHQAGCHQKKKKYFLGAFSLSSLLGNNLFYFSRCFTILGPNWFMLLNSVLSRLSWRKLCQETFPKRLLVTYDMIHLLLPFLCLCCECVCMCVYWVCVFYTSYPPEDSPKELSTDAKPQLNLIKLLIWVDLLPAVFTSFMSFINQFEKHYLASKILQVFNVLMVSLCMFLFFFLKNKCMFLPSRLLNCFALGGTT